MKILISENIILERIAFESLVVISFNHYQLEQLIVLLVQSVSSIQSLYIEPSKYCIVWRLDFNLSQYVYITQIVSTNCFSSTSYQLIRIPDIIESILHFLFRSILILILLFISYIKDRT